MKIKRIISLVLTVAMVASLATFCFTSNASDTLFNSGASFLPLSTSAVSLFDGSYEPDQNAKGVTFWIRVKDAKEPFYLCNWAMSIHSRDFVFTTYNHGQDGIRNAMWKIEGNGDYLFYIPFNYYSLSHQFIGEKGDYIKNITHMELSALELSTANRSAKVALMGIFDNRVETYNSEFDVDGNKTEMKGSYTYNRCEITESGWKTTNIEDTEYYDPVLGHNDRLEEGTIDYTDTIKRTWVYAYADAGMPEAPVKDGYVFDGWVNKDNDPMIPYGSNSLKASFTAATGAMHTVKFYDGDDTLLYTAKVLDGMSAVYHGSTPKKESAGSTMFKFTGWDQNIMYVTGDLEVKPTFDEVPITFEVTYKNGDKTVCVNSVKKFEASVFDEKFYGTPKQNGDAEKYYVFSGWADAEGNAVDLSNIIEDVTVYAAYNEIPETERYTLTFVDYDGTELFAATTGVHSYIEYGAKEPERKPTETTIYTFAGWDPDNYSDLRETKTIKAVYAESPVETGSKTGMVIDKTSDFSSMSEIKVVEGYTFKTNTNYLTLILKLEGVEQPFTLGGFRAKTLSKNSDGSISNQILDSNNSQNYQSSRTAFTFLEDGYYCITIAMGEINWIGSNYHRITSLSFNNGASVGESTYNPNDNLKVTFLAMYEGRPTFSVRYYDEKGEFLSVGAVINSTGNMRCSKLLGADEAFGGVAPEKESDEDYKYVFAGWADKDGNKIESVIDNADVYAYYDKEIKNPVNVKFVNGEEEIASYVIAKGKTVSYDGKEPVKESTSEYTYIWKGWTTDPAKVISTETEAIPEAINEDVTFYAVYEQVDRMSTVTFVNDDNTVLGIVYVDGKGEVIGTVPTAEKNADVQYTYTFEKWVNAAGEEVKLSEVTSDVTVKASYTATLNKYTVTFLNDDEKELSKVEVDYGTAATTETPVKEFDGMYTYTFEKWVGLDDSDANLSKITGNVTVKAKYTAEFSKFSDVAAGAWYTDKVEYAVVKGYMSGMTNTTFEPNGKTTRAQLVQVLYNIEGRPDVSSLKNPFTDVKNNEWYTDAIKWAYDVGVVSGMTKTTYEPNSAITREQFCLIMYNYSEKIKKYDMNIPMTAPVSLGVFTDKNSISNWASNAVKWCLYVGCVSGYPEANNKQSMKPKNNTTRAEMATILKLWETSDKLASKAE